YQAEGGMVVIKGRLEPEVGALLQQALAAARESLYQRGRQRATFNAGPGEASAEPIRISRQPADALALLAETALHQGLDPGPSGPRPPLSGVRSPRHPGASSPPLGPRGPDHALKPCAALSPASPRGARGGLSGRALTGRGAPVPAAERSPAA